MRHVRLLVVSYVRFPRESGEMSFRFGITLLLHVLSCVVVTDKDIVLAVGVRKFIEAVRLVCRRRVVAS